MIFDKELKSEIFLYCQQYVADRIDRFSSAIESAQNDANNETKSSSGDKHETGRAMAQLETENNSKHLIQAQKLKIALGQINPGVSSNQAEPGALVVTDNGNFFIAISAGKIDVQGNTIHLISLASPLGQILSGKRENESFQINGKTFKIHQIE